MTMKQFRVAVLPGDGIGPEVTREGVRVLRFLQPYMEGVQFELQEFSVGAGEYLRGGDAMPGDTFTKIAEADSILLGAIGLPDVRYPSGQEIAPQLDLREQLDLYCGLRPIRLFHRNDTPLRNAPQIDFSIVRENTEGLFWSRKSGYDSQSVEVVDQLRISRPGAERVFRSAFRIARKRRRLVTLVDKANVLPSMSFFRGIFYEVAEQFPDVKADHVYVDAATLYLVQRPETFDVIVTENLFGDILSDLAAALVGGMGMAPSADIGEACAVFQPAHGSAPDIAGAGIANPVAMILSVAMMLEWLDHEQTRAAAQLLQTAVEQSFRDPALRTPDLGGTLTTIAMTDAVLSRIAAGNLS